MADKKPEPDLIVGTRLPPETAEAFLALKAELASKGDPMSVTDASIARICITDYLVRGKYLKKAGAR